MYMVKFVDHHLGAVGVRILFCVSQPLLVPVLLWLLPLLALIAFDSPRPLLPSVLDKLVLPRG